MTFQYAVMTGNPMDGFVAFGPFEDSYIASEWAEKEINDDWWVIHLTNPGNHSSED